jgi:hypothetical protein
MDQITSAEKQEREAIIEAVSGIRKTRARLGHDQPIKRRDRDWTYIAFGGSRLFERYQADDGTNARAIFIQAALLLRPKMSAQDIRDVLRLCEKKSTSSILPKLILRNRTRSEIDSRLDRLVDQQLQALGNIPSLKSDSDSDWIGVSVLLAFRQLKQGGGQATIAKAISEICEGGNRAGFRLGSEETVRRHYIRYRKLATVRGYADYRAYEAEMIGDPWPDDQVWMSDFPAFRGVKK